MYRTTKLGIESLEGRQMMVADLGTGLLLLQRSDIEGGWSLGTVRSPVTTQIVPLDWQTIATEDFTSDGVTDVLGSVQETWWLQVNDGTQLHKIPWGTRPTANSEVLSHGDFNGDGWLDILSRDVATGAFWLSRNSVDGFVNEQWGGWSRQTVWTSILVGDFNDDGRLDVLGSETGGNWWLAQNSGTSFRNQHWGKISSRAWRNIVAGDFDGDHFLDVAARAPDDTWWVWSGDATPGFSTPVYRGHWKFRDAWHDVNVADITGDGADDLVGRTEDGRLWVGSLHNSKFQTTTWGTRWQHAANWKHVALLDVDRDGKIDQVGIAQDGTAWVAKNFGQKFQIQYFGRTNESPEHLEFIPSFTTSAPIDVSQFLPTVDPGNSSGENTGGGNTGEGNTGEGNANHGQNPSVDHGEQGTRPTSSTYEVHPDRLVRYRLDELNQVVLVGAGVELLGIELRSPSGRLIPSFNADGASNASPFQFALSNTKHVITLGNLKTPYRLDGNLTLSVGYDTSDLSDLTVAYGINKNPYQATVL